MTDSRCPHCGCPLAELLPGSVHRAAEGRVGYRRCACGEWLVEIDGIVVGSTGLSRS
ncbi:hypothetical protein LWP59_19005 [Amycolatopsis acidiphila]|uniref:hypothetical protein n=1 Tax=Amycolatopsis acidiphila TaxID=715473 RepID=UPI001643964C|nr:hypothetical protein [Amycolatopsis acidiphila]UIJ63569.1 hypothetical protein LWP59_19005 [Amycolatopsis acidiphila]